MVLGGPLSLEVVLAGSWHFRALLDDDRDVDGASHGPARGRAEGGRRLHEGGFGLAFDEVGAGPGRLELRCRVSGQVRCALGRKSSTFRIKRCILVVTLIGFDFGLQHSITNCTLHVIRICDRARLMFILELLEHFLGLRQI